MGNPDFLGFAVVLFASSTGAAAAVTSTPAPDFSTTACHVFDAVVACGLIGAFGGALTTRFILEPYKSKTQERLTHLESALTTERDERKALRDHVEAQDAKRFDLLHEWRAKAMSETYATLCNLEDAYDALARSVAGFVDGPTPTDYWRDLDSAIIEFRKAFWTKRILFDKDLAGDLAMLNRAYYEISNLYSSLYTGRVNEIAESERSDEALHAIENDVLLRILTSDRYHGVNDCIDGVRGKIEERFRKLFGVTEDA